MKYVLDFQKIIMIFMANLFLILYPKCMKKLLILLMVFILVSCSMGQKNTQKELIFVPESQSGILQNTGGIDAT
jgi:hypothetical protein